MSESRIFLGNLPPGATESGLRKWLQKLGGRLTEVAIKQRTDHQGQVTATFAHCSLAAEDVGRCLDRVMEEQWKGHSVKAEIAKKSQQQRLEERVAVSNGAAAAPAKANGVHAENKRRPEPKPQFEDDDSDEGEVYWKAAPGQADAVDMVAEEPNPKRRRREEEAPTKLYQARPTNAQSALLERLQKFSSVWGDDDDHTGYFRSRPISARTPYQHVEEKPPPEAPAPKEPKKEKKKKKDLSTEEVPGEKKKTVTKSEKKKISEEKRLQSLDQRAEQLKSKQDMLKKALAGKASGNNKIKFDDDDDEPAEGSSFKRQKVTLFEEDSGDDDDVAVAENFKIKKQFEGKKGEKLLELQSRFGMDERFKLDKRFADKEQAEEEPKPSHEDPEVANQMAILEGIVGPLKRREKVSSSMKPIVRYDPSKPDHDEKYKLHKKTREEEEEENETNETPMPEVSSERYFEVKTDFQKVLKDDQEKGFSLRNLFGGREEDSDQDGESKELKSQDVQNSKPKRLVKNPLEREDSSDESAGEEMPEHKAAPVIGLPSASSDAFFFSHNDPRFEEGLAFFKSVKVLGKEEFVGKRRAVWSTIKSKKKSFNRKKTMFAKKLGGRPNKNKFVKGRGGRNNQRSR